MADATSRHADARPRWRRDAGSGSSRRSALETGTAVLLFVIADVHLNLYAREDYDRIPTVAWLFLVTVFLAAALGVAVLVRPGRLSDSLAGGFASGVLGAYLLTLYLPDGLFGFKEPGISYSGAVATAAEAAVAVVSLGAFAHRAQADARRARRRPVADR